jgi:hypothetical protein
VTFVDVGLKESEREGMLGFQREWRVRVKREEMEWNGWVS